MGQILFPALKMSMTRLLPSTRKYSYSKGSVALYGREGPRGALLDVQGRHELGLCPGRAPAAGSATAAFATCHQAPSSSGAFATCTGAFGTGLFAVSSGMGRLSMGSSLRVGVSATTAVGSTGEAGVFLLSPPGIS